MPRSVWLLTALFVALGAWWSVIAPVGDTPDEPAHFDLVAHVAESGRYPDYDGRAKSVAAGFMRRPNVPRTPEAAQPRSARAGISNGGGGRPLVWRDPATGVREPQANQMPQHPPLYYVVAATGLRVVRGIAGHELFIDREVLLLRLLGVMMTSVVPIASFEAARRLGASAGAAKAAAVTTLAVPQVLHVSAAVSYMPLAIGTGAVLAVFVAGVLRGDERRSTAAIVGALVAVALWTTASAVFLLPGVALAFLHRARVARASRRVLANRAVLALGTAVALGSPWWVRNWIRHGTPTPSTDSDLYAALQPPDGFTADPRSLVETAYDLLPVRFFGAFGTRFSAELGPAVVTALTILFAVGLVAALVPRRFGRDDGLTTWRVVVLLSPAPLLLVFVVYRSWDIYSMSGRVTFLQGRYLLVAFVPVVVAVGAGLTRLIGRWTPVSLLLIAGLVQVEATRAVLGGWWAEPTAALTRKLDAVSAWNGGFDALPRVLLVVMAVFGVGALVALARRPTVDVDVDVDGQRATSSGC